MKILVVCQYYYPEPFRITDICENLVKKGHDITVLTGLPNYPEGKVLKSYRYGKRRKEIINGVKIIRSFEIGRGKSKVRLFLNYLSYAISATIKVIFIKERFDVILVNQLSPVTMGIPAMAYKKKYNKKILLYCLDLWPASLVAGGISEDSKIYRVFEKISRWIYKYSDTILVTSGMFKSYFEEKLNLKDSNIKYLPQYAEDLFSENKYKSIKLYKKNNKEYNFVFAGNIGEMQSVDTIIKAANELSKNNFNIKFHIVGDGSKLDYCKNISKQMGLKNILFYGRRPINEMPHFYNMADAMLITLKDDKFISNTLPGKIQSYMAASKPIIGAINGEAKYVIESSKCGFCTYAEDYINLSKIILKFCDSNKKEEMALSAYKYYVDNYSKKKFMDYLEKELKLLEG